MWESGLSFGVRGHIFISRSNEPGKITSRVWPLNESASCVGIKTQQDFQIAIPKRFGRQQVVITCYGYRIVIK